MEHWIKQESSLSLFDDDMEQYNPIDMQHHQSSEYKFNELNNQDSMGSIEALSFDDNYASMHVFNRQDNSASEEMQPVPNVALNQLFNKLFYEENIRKELLEDSPIQNEINESDVHKFFIEGKSSNTGENCSSPNDISSSDKNALENAWNEFIKDQSQRKNRSKHESLFTKSPKNREHIHEASNNYREKKRLKKMQAKQNRKISSDQSSDYSKSHSDPASKTQSNRGDDEFVTPQKRKGTIWKILFPNKKSESSSNELERLVWRQVEQEIAKNPKVIKSCNELEAFEASEEGKSMDRSEFTKKKNRISAQLSRERREAIMHSLIKVWIENIKAKKELDSDVDEVKRILKETLCSGCKDNLRGLSKGKNPSTLKMQASVDKASKKNKKNPAISISGGGAMQIIMSIAAIAVFACIASVSLSPNTQDNFMATHSDSVMFDDNPVRMLATSTYNCEEEDCLKFTEFKEPARFEDVEDYNSKLEKLIQ